MADLNVIHELTMLYLRQKDISSLMQEVLTVCRGIFLI